MIDDINVGQIVFIIILMTIISIVVGIGISNSNDIAECKIQINDEKAYLDYKSHSIYCCKDIKSLDDNNDVVYDIECVIKRDE